MELDKVRLPQCVKRRPAIFAHNGEDKAVHSLLRVYAIPTAISLSFRCRQICRSMKKRSNGALECTARLFLREQFLWKNVS